MTEEPTITGLLSLIDDALLAAETFSADDMRPYVEEVRAYAALLASKQVKSPEACDPVYIDEVRARAATLASERVNPPESPDSYDHIYFDVDTGTYRWGRP